MNLTYVFTHGDPILIATFLLLIFMSLTSWYIIFWKAIIIWAEHKYLQKFTNNYITTQDWPKYILIEQQKGSVEALLQEVEKTRPLLDENDDIIRQQILTMHLSQRLDKIRIQLDKGLTILASVGSSAPFIGLFGTVWGIYGALTDIATEGNANLNVVAGPMGEALVATAIGLFAAIPAVLAYNGFVRNNRVSVQQLRYISEQLALYTKVEGTQ